MLIEQPLLSVGEAQPSSRSPCPGSDSISNCPLHRPTLSCMPDKPLVWLEVKATCGSNPTPWSSTWSLRNCGSTHRRTKASPVLSMPGNIGQRFLDDAESDGFNLGGKTVLQPAVFEMDLDIRPGCESFKLYQQRRQQTLNRPARSGAGRARSHGFSPIIEPLFRWRGFSCFWASSAES